MNTYVYHHDAGHGWLKVPLGEIPGNLDISKFSYMDNEFAYLEEDADMHQFLATLEDDTYELVEKWDGDRSFIRNKRAYTYG